MPIGCKIYHGPYVYNFEEIYKILEKHKISKKIENIDDLANYITDGLICRLFNKGYKINLELGNQTLTNTIKNINNHILNEI